MKRINKFLVLLLMLCTVFSCFAACENGDNAENTDDKKELDWVDYTSKVKLDMDSPTAKVELLPSDIKQFIDGDTTHFFVPESISQSGVLKARYLAVNTPESTGTIEEWGKKASNFTKEKLKSAVAIVIESDNSTWNYDSTGDRLLVWVWYKTKADGEYINLNLELLQEGLAIASNSSNNIYGTACMNAIKQAQAHKLYVYSDEPDPDFYYGEAQELTIKELRINAEKYAGTKVAFEGIVARNSGNNGIYVEAYDEETGMYNGIYVYYGFSFNQVSVVRPGNKVRIVGSMQFYEAGGTYQIADLKYDMMDIKNPNNVQKLGEGFSAAYTEISPELFNDGTVSITVIEDGEELIKNVPYAEMALASTVSMKALVVTDVYTTEDPDSSSNGAMTLTCKAGDKEVTVRTAILCDENGDLVTADAFIGKTIDVRGIVDNFDGEYQIKVFTLSDITINN